MEEWPGSIERCAGNSESPRAISAATPRDSNIYFIARALPILSSSGLGWQCNKTRFEASNFSLICAAIAAFFAVILQSVLQSYPPCERESNAVDAKAGKVVRGDEGDKPTHRNKRRDKCGEAPEHEESILTRAECRAAFN